MYIWGMRHKHWIYVLFDWDSIKLSVYFLAYSCVWRAAQVELFCSFFGGGKNNNSTNNTGSMYALLVYIQIVLVNCNDTADLFFFFSFFLNSRLDLSSMCKKAVVVDNDKRKSIPYIYLRIRWTLNIRILYRHWCFCICFLISTLFWNMQTNIIFVLDKDGFFLLIIF